MSTIEVRPAPGLPFETHEATPALAEWLARRTGDGSVVVVLIYGWRFSARSGLPIPIVVTGSVFGGKIYGDAVAVPEDLVAAQAAGLLQLPSSGVDLAVLHTDVDDEPGAESVTPQGGGEIMQGDHLWSTRRRSNPADHPPSDRAAEAIPLGNLDDLVADLQRDIVAEPVPRVGDQFGDDLGVSMRYENRDPVQTTLRHVSS